VSDERQPDGPGAGESLLEPLFMRNLKPRAFFLEILSPLEYHGPFLEILSPLEYLEIFDTRNAESAFPDTLHCLGPRNNST
jgi:hypothetical protein